MIWCNPNGKPAKRTLKSFGTGAQGTIAMALLKTLSSEKAAQKHTFRDKEKVNGDALIDLWIVCSRSPKVVCKQSRSTITGIALTSQV